MNRGRMSFGLWLVFAGILVLLTNLGWLDRAFWLALVELWPLLLILFGLHLVLSRTIFWILPVLIGVAFAGAVFIFGAEIPFLPWTNATRVTEEFTYQIGPEVENLDIQIDVGAVDLVLRRGEAGNISGSLVATRAPVVTHRATENSVRLTLNQVGGQRRWNVLLDELARWEVFVPEGVPVELDLDGGAGDFMLDFRGLDTRSVVLRGGAARFVLQFDEVGSHTTVRAESGVADIRIQVPAEVGLRVYTTGALVNHNLSAAGLERQNGYWQTLDYEQNERTIDINIDSAVGNIQVTRD